MLGSTDVADDTVICAPVGCATPFWLVDTMRVMSMGSADRDTPDETGTWTGLASEDRLVRAVTLEYGA
jgi:hypothetical protein